MVVLSHGYLQYKKFRIRAYVDQNKLLNDKEVLKRKQVSSLILGLVNQRFMSLLSGKENTS